MTWRIGGISVTIYNANDPTTILDDLILVNDVTNTNFYSIVEILFIFTDIFFPQNESDIKFEKNNHPL